MRFASLFFTTVVAAFALLFSAQTALAEAPGKPVEFGATVVENGTMVKLFWQANRDGGEPTSFSIYVAEGETENEADFTLLAETDAEPNANGLYTYLVKDLEPGIYTFFVKANNADGTSGRSIIRVVKLGENNNGTGKPGTPIEFSAKVVEEGTIVKLTWMRNYRDGGAPSVFLIYMAEGETEDMDDFSLIAEVEAAPNMQVYNYLVKDLEPGEYSFYIIAKNDDGSSERTMIKVVVLEDPDAPRVFIVSKPENGGKEGTPWDYQVRIESNFTPTAVEYALLNAPEGMEIDAEGKIVWNEPKNGRYEICVVVTATDGTNTVTAKQCWVLEIGDGRNEPKEEVKCAEIVGTVKADDLLGSPIMEGVVVAWREGNNNANKDRGRVYKAEIRQGTYAMAVPAGTYRIYVEGPGIHKEWFEDVDNADDATEVVVTCENPRNEVNFVVTRRPEPTMHKVCGTVYDAESNEPIKNALVTFEWRENSGDDRPNGNHKRIVAESDADGKYCVNLPEGYTYVAYAIARTPNKAQDMYHQEWYDDTHAANEATPIEVTGDMDGVDFPMDKREAYNGGFSGTMMDHATEEGVPGKVIAYMIKESGNSGNEKTRRAYTTETNESGEYAFEGIAPGVYIVLGLPGDRPYVPGWHVDDGAAASSWKDATRIEVGDIMLTVQHDIRLEQLTDGIGRGRANGRVFGRGRGFIEKSGGKVQVNEGILGSLVVARDEDGNIVDFALTSVNGEFTLTQLGYGTSTIYADALDFEPATSMVTIDPNATTAETEIGLAPVVTSVEVPTYRVGVDLNLYPNPANDVATLSFPSTDGKAEVKIVSSTGVVMMTDAFTATNGTATFQIETSSLPSGMFLVHVTNGTTTFALPLSVVR